MSVHTRTLVGSGIRRVISPAGVALFLTFLLTLAVFNAAVNTLLSAVAGTPLPTGGEVAEYGVVLPVHPVLAVLVALLALFVGAFAIVVGTRFLLGRSVRRWANPVECLTHRVVPATVSVIVAAGVAVVAVTLGTAFLVIPGIVVAAHLLLVPAVLAAEDVSVVDALWQSWRRAATGRVQLATATLALVVPAVLVVAAASLSYLLPPSVEFWLGVAIGAVVILTWLGIATEAYQQLGTTSGPRRGRARPARQSL